MKLKPVNTEIIDRIKEVCPRTWRSQVPLNVTTPRTPYSIVYFVPPVRSARDRALTTTRNDTLVSGFTVQIAANTAEDAEEMRDLIMDHVTGYRPDNCGEIGLESGAPHSRASTLVDPNLYLEGLYFSFRTNLRTER